MFQTKKEEGGKVYKQICKTQQSFHTLISCMAMIWKTPNLYYVLYITQVSADKILLKLEFQSHISGNVLLKTACLHIPIHYIPLKMKIITSHTKTNIALK